MPFLPFTILRPGGIGTASSCRSRAIEVIERGIQACSRHESFRFSIDTVWAIEAWRQNGGTEPTLVDLHESGRLSIGALWAGVENACHPVCMLRDLQLGVAALESIGIDPRTIALRSGHSDRWKSVVAASRLESAHLPGDGVSKNGNLGLRFLSDEAVVQRDAEREIDKVQGPVLLGGELWCPSERTVDMLIERAHDAGIDLTCVTWDGLSDTGDGEAVDPPDWSSMLPGVHASLSRVTTELLKAERTLAMGILLGEKPSAADLAPLWRHHLENLAGAFTGSGDEVKRSELEAACDGLLYSAKRIREQTGEAIAASVDAGEGPEGIVPIVVFNPSTRAVSDCVETHVVYYGESRATDFSRYEFYRLVDEDGNVVPVEEVSGKQVETAEILIRFVARDVPALGYRTYYLVPKPQDTNTGQTLPIQAPGAMMPDFPEPTFAVEDVEERVSTAKRGLRLGRSFTAGSVVVDVDEVTGRVGIVDRSGRALLHDVRIEAREDDMESAPGHFSPTGRILPWVVSSVDLVESGEVSGRLLLTGKIGSSDVNLSIRMYADLPYVDFRITMMWRESHPASVEFSGAFGEGFTNGTCETAFRETAWDLDGGEATADRRCFVSGDSGALSVQTDRTPLKVSGRVFRSPLLLSSPDPASYAYNKIWLSYPNRLTYDVRVATGGESSNPDGPEGALWAHAVYDRASARKRPASAGTLAFDSGARVLAVRPSRDGVEADICETSGQANKVNIGGTQVEAVDGENVVELGQYELRSIRVKADG